MAVVERWLFWEGSTVQRFFSRTAGIFGVGRRPTHLRPLAEATQKPETAREKSLAPKVNAGKVYGRSNNVSKQSNSAIRRDTDEWEFT